MSNAIRQINKLFVGNLPWTISQNELKKYFSEYGQVINATVLFDKNTGLSKGFGFVSFANKEAVDKVLTAESHVLEGCRVNVQPSDNIYTSRNNNSNRDIE